MRGLQTAHTVVLAVLGVELVLGLKAYSMFRNMNTSEDYRRETQKNFPWALEKFYKVAEFADPDSTIRKTDFEKWSVDTKADHATSFLTPDHYPGIVTQESVLEEGAGVINQTEVATAEKKGKDASLELVIERVNSKENRSTLPQQLQTPSPAQLSQQQQQTIIEENVAKE